MRLLPVPLPVDSVFYLRRNLDVCLSRSNCLFGTFSSPHSFFVIDAFMWRGLQGSYNEFTTRHNIKIPFGPVIVFAAAYVDSIVLYPIYSPTMAAVGKSCTHSFFGQIVSRQRIMTGTLLPMLLIFYSPLNLGFRELARHPSKLFESIGKCFEQPPWTWKT